MNVIDLDGHILEPRHAWSRFMDRDKLDRALRIEDRPIEVHGVSGYRPHVTHKGRVLFPITSVHPKGIEQATQGRAEALVDPGAAKRRSVFEELRQAMFAFDEGSLPEGWDPTARLAWMDANEIDATTLFPTWGLAIEEHLTDDVESLTLNMSAYNRWLVDLCEADRRRLFPVASLTLADVDWAVREIEQLAALGVRVGMVRPALHGGRTVAHPAHERFWEALQHNDMALAFHVGHLGAGGEPIFGSEWYDPVDNAPADSDLTVAILPHLPVQLSLVAMFRTGIFARYPKLRLGVFELGATWIPSFIATADVVFRVSDNPRHAAWPLPSEQIARSLWVAPMEHEDVADCVRTIGDDRVVFSSDYPHPESSARPLELYRRRVARLGDQSRRKVFAQNALAFLGMW